MYKQALMFVIETYLHGTEDLDNEAIMRSLSSGTFPDGTNATGDYESEDPKGLFNIIDAQARDLVIFAKMQQKELLQASTNALADLEGIMPVIDPSGDRHHPGWKTIEELRASINEAAPESERITEKQKYFAAEIFVRNGEYEYTKPMVLKAENLEAATVKADEHNKTYYSGEAEPWDDGYFFHAGCVYVHMRNVVEINKAQYDVLSCFTDAVAG